MIRLAAGAVSLLAVAALTACTSTQDVLEPSAIAAQQQQTTATTGAQPSQPGAAAPQPSSQTAPSPAPSGTGAAITTNARIQIAPIVGASVEAATPLSERLASRARERGIRLAGASDTTATHVLKGYFSALTEGKETTVVYVWDIYDPAGTRLHRINGQQKVQISGGEGWSSVPASAMQAIADITVDQLAAWLAGSTG